MAGLEIEEAYTTHRIASASNNKDDVHYHTYLFQP